MKKRSGGRRPVLDLQTDQPHKSALWPNNMNMGSPSNANSGSGALAGLLGDYGSDSNSEDEALPKAPTIPDNMPNLHQQPIWSMCVDPSSGFPYYWEQITNTVSWEPPPGLALNLPSSATSTVKTVTTPQVVPPKQTNQRTQKSGQRKAAPKEDSSSEEEIERIELITSYYNSDSGSEDEEAKRKSVVRVYPPIAKPKSKDKTNKTNTSVPKAFGPEMPKKFGPELPKNFGPELPTDFVPKPVAQLPVKSFGPELLVDLEPQNGSKLSSESAESDNVTPLIDPSFSNNVDLNVTSDSAVKPDLLVASTAPNHETCQNIQLKLIDSEADTKTQECNKIESITQETTVNGENKLEVQSDDVEHDNVISLKLSLETNSKKTENEFLDSKSADPTETDNLEDLMEAKTKLLKKLGELVPSEIKYLVGSPKSSSATNSRCQSPVKSPQTPVGSPPPAKSHTALDMDVDDLIAQIEKEQPIDQPVNSSDASETVCSMESASNKSTYTAEETSQSKSDLPPFKPLFPSANNIDEIPPIIAKDELAYDKQKINTLAEESQEPVSNENKLQQVIDPSSENKLFNKYEVNPSESGIENAAFKRKRRIALDVLPAKRHALNEEAPVASSSEAVPMRDLSYTTKYAQNFESCGERMGLGFQPDLNERDFNTKKTVYSEFKKGNIMFHKGETLVPTVAESEEKLEDVDSVEDKKALIEAKLKFLTQSLPPVPPLQQLYIELQTLWAVAKSSGLKPYLNGWLDTAGAELTRLELNAAPPQWTCTFSSESGCYVYENEVSGQQQWQYPGLEDMDICTTPPPPPPPPPEEPPPPPPPPPPQISTSLPSEPLPPGTVSPPLSAPPLPPPAPKITSEDLKRVNTQIGCFPPPPPPLSMEVPPKDEALCAALDSFYSDLADLETVPPAPAPAPAPVPVPVPPLPATAAPRVAVPNAGLETNQDKTKKKKIKTKISTSGLKNKSVSSLVEKWKKVQETLDS